MNTITHNNQSGRSMIEMLAVLMIIGIITVTALAGLNQGMKKYYVSKMHTDIQSIAQDVANLYAWKRSYPTSISMSELCASDIFPDKCDSSSTAPNPFGGSYTVSAAKDSDNTPYLLISASSIPSDACEDLTLKEWTYVAKEAACSGSTFSIGLY